MIQPTSLEAYNYIKPNLAGRRLAVYRVILEHGPICIEDVALKMGVYPNKISGRFGELHNKSMILNTLKRKITGHTSHILWRTTTSKEQRDGEEFKRQGQGTLF